MKIIKHRVALSLQQRYNFGTFVKYKREKAMKLREWNARLHGLVIFRALLEDPVVAKLLDLTDRIKYCQHVRIMVLHDP